MAPRRRRMASSEALRATLKSQRAKGVPVESRRAGGTREETYPERCPWLPLRRASPGTQAEPRRDDSGRRVMRTLRKNRGVPLRREPRLRQPRRAAVAPPMWGRSRIGRACASSRAMGSTPDRRLFRDGCARSDRELQPLVVVAHRFDGALQQFTEPGDDRKFRFGSRALYWHNRSLSFNFCDFERQFSEVGANDALYWPGVTPRRLPNARRRISALLKPLALATSSMLLRVDASWRRADSRRRSSM